LQVPFDILQRDTVIFIVIYFGFLLFALKTDGTGEKSGNVSPRGWDLLVVLITLAIIAVYARYRQESRHMDTRTYWICSLIVTLIVAGLESWAVQIGNPYLAVITLLWAVGTLYLCRKRVHEVIEDERNVRINKKAAMKALEVFVIGGVIAGVVLYAIFQTLYARLPGVSR
jgi:uncharacterized membrane protein